MRFLLLALILGTPTPLSIDPPQPPVEIFVKHPDVDNAMDAAETRLLELQNEVDNGTYDAGPDQTRLGMQYGW